MRGVRVLRRADGTRFALFESPYWLDGSRPTTRSSLDRLVAEGMAG